MAIKDNILDACKFIYYVSVVACTVCFRKKGKQLFRTYAQIIQSIAYFVFFVVCAVISWEEQIFPFPQISKSKIINFISLVSTHTINVATIVKYLTSQLHCKTLCKALEKMEDIDKTVKLFTKDMSKFHTFIWKRSLLMTVLFIFYYICLTVFSFLSYSYSIPQFITLIMFQLIQFSGFLQLWAWTVAIRDRFKILNTFLDDNAQESLRMKYPVDEIAFEENLMNLTNVHESLTKVARTVNMCFYSFLFFYTFFYYVTLASNGYIMVYLLVFATLKDWYNIMTIANCFQFICYQSVFLYTTLITLTEMCQQANCTAGVLTGIRIGLNKISSRNLVTAKTLSLMNNKLEITAVKLFKMDMALLHSIIASITIYLVIMLQFDIELLKKSVVKEISNSTA